MEGVRELGSVVCGHIGSLQSELKAMRKESTGSDAVDDPNLNSADQDDKMFKGALVDRYG